jgi:hypothetical protein
MTADGSRFMPRAQRFSRPASLLYRPAGEERWREGRMENISQTGVLFHGREPIDVTAPVEIMMEVPAEVGGTGNASLGRGHIVRHGAERSDSRPALAASIVAWEVLEQDPRRI